MVDFDDILMQIYPLLSDWEHEETYQFSCVGDDVFGGSNSEIVCYISYPQDTPPDTPGRWGLAYQTAHFDPDYAANPVNKVFCEDEPCLYCTASGCP